MGDTHPDPVVCMQIFGDTGADQETAPALLDYSSSSSDDDEKKSKTIQGSTQIS